MGNLDKESFKIFKISEIGTIISGATPKTSDDSNFGGAIPWLTPADLSGYKDKYISCGARNITQKGYDSCSTQLMPAGSVLLSSRAPIGYVAIAKNPICTNQGFKSIVPKTNVDSEYLYYHLLYLKKTLQDMGSGTTFKELSAKKLGQVEVSLPSLNEQKRIVARIEELFSELDAAVATLERTKEQLAVYRQAVLKEAFESLPPETSQAFIKDVCHEIKVGIVIKPKQYYTDESSGIRAFRSANVREFYVNDADWVYLTESGHEQNKRSEIHTGDVLVVRSGYPGTACVVPEEFNNCNAVDILIAVPDLDKITSEYLCAYTNSPHGRKLVTEKKRGVAQAHLNVGGYSQMKIPIPDIETQKQVVDGIELKLSIYDNILKTLESSLQEAEAMRQSILKQAFAGEL